MKKEQQLIDLENKKDNLINFDTARKALATGGVIGNEDWLKDLPAGSVFLAKRKDQPKEILVLDLYCVLEHKELTSNLMLKTPDNRQMDVWFKTLEFSRAYLLIEVIATVEFGYDHGKTNEEAPEGDKANGNGDGSL